MFKKIGLITSIVLIVCITLMYSDILREKPKVFRDGEMLKYKVKWSFIRVGTLQLFNEGLVPYNGGEYIKLRIIIDSAKGLPFVNIHDVYESYVDSNSVPVAFYAFENKGDYVLETDYVFDFNKRVVNVEVRKAYQDSVVRTKTDELPMDATYRDILSLLFYARQVSGERKQNIELPTFVLEGKDTCYFHEVGEIREIKNDGEKEQCFYIKGKVKFIGIAGIKDDFQGWFSIDNQRVPIKAKMKAFFGSITIQLEEFKNWRDS